MKRSRQDANDISNQMAAAVRQSNRQPLDDVAKKFNLELGDTPPVLRSPSPSATSAIRPTSTRFFSSFTPAN